MKISSLNPRCDLRLRRCVFPLWRSSVELSVLGGEGFDVRARKI